MSLEYANIEFKFGVSWCELESDGGHEMGDGDGMGDVVLVGTIDRVCLGYAEMFITPPI